MLYDFFFKNIFLFILLLLLLLVLILVEIIQLFFYKKSIKPQDLVKFINRDNIMLFDFRNKKDFFSGHIVNSINLSIDDFIRKPKLIKGCKNKKLVIIHYSNYKSLIIVKKITKFINTKDLYYLVDGYDSWIKAGYPINKS